MAAVATEQSPLLGEKTEQVEEEDQQHRHVLVEVIGATYLQSDDPLLEPYCAAQFGTKTIHKTKPTKGTDPIWTLATNSLFVLSFSPSDVANNKQLTVTIWAKRQAHALSNAARKVVTGTKVVEFHGKIKLSVDTIISHCDGERTELELRNELGGDILQGDEDSSRLAPTVALRFRVATEADLNFVQVWQQHQKLDTAILNGTGMIEDERRPLASLVTETNESEVTGATLMSAISSSMSTSPRSTIRVKPHPDPQRPHITNFMKPQELKEETMRPSHHWVESGSGTLGRLYLEILSCHDLPNIDVGSSVGNLTDPFVCAVYEDALAETPVIDDELNPHWPPWTQRAFCFNIMHPSSVLYISVFGYKRRLLSHRPIGRVEINPGNLQRDTVYNLQYSLAPSSHVVDRKSCGTIKVRLRVAFNDERAVLMAALKPPPEIYLNVAKQKSWPVVRYTCRGEYENEDKFHLKVLLAYRDEIVDGYLHRILFTINDATQSLIFWRGQVRIGPVLFPLHSLILFCMAVILVERPYMLPALVPLCIAWFMLANMCLRLQEPSPWNQCFSFGHYLQILLFGYSSQTFEEIKVGEGHEESMKMKMAMKKRIDEDRTFIVQKFVMEEEIKTLERKDFIETQVNQLLDIELLTILGNLQGIVGGICRLCRFVHVVVTWEESALSFWITAVCLAVGIIFSCLPWAFILTWSGRIAVWGFLGPHMKLIDMMRKAPQNKNIRNLLAGRFFHVRRRQEEAIKLKAFRARRFGKFSTRVPGIMWTPHCDRPLPESEAQLMINSQESREFPTISNDLPYIPGQQLYGWMIPRPQKEWARNLEASKREQERLEAILQDLTRSSPIVDSPLKKAESTRDDDDDGLRDEGVEVSQMFDPGWVANAPKQLFNGRLANLFSWKRSSVKSSSTEEGRRPTRAIDDDNDGGIDGVEVSDLYDEEAGLVASDLRSDAAKGIDEDDNLCDAGAEVGDLEDEASFAQRWEDSGKVQDDEGGSTENASSEHATSLGYDDSWRDAGYEIVESEDSSSHRSEDSGKVQVEEGSSVESVPVIGIFNDGLNVQEEEVSILGEAVRNIPEESMQDLGVEVLDLFETEARFVQQSWNRSISEILDDNLQDEIKGSP